MGVPSAQTRKAYQATTLASPPRQTLQPSGVLGLFNTPASIAASPSRSLSHLSQTSPNIPPGQRSRVVRIREEVLTLNVPQAAPSPSLSPVLENVEIEIDEADNDDGFSSGSEVDDEPAHSLYTPATTYRSIISPAIRSELLLPNSSNQWNRAFPALTDNLKLPPPQECSNGWRWDTFGRGSDIRSTLDEDKRKSSEGKPGRTSTLYTSGILSRDIASPLPPFKTLLHPVLPVQYEMKEEKRREKVGHKMADDYSDSEERHDTVFHHISRL